MFVSYSSCYDDFLLTGFHDFNLFMYMSLQRTLECAVITLIDTL